ncbi:MAG TPA: hypothetical protein VFX28_04640, partial [Methylomirabilota bacterium]|nr:hypothetical protein [Methylomirabilota bacterium]
MSVRGGLAGAAVAAVAALYLWPLAQGGAWIAGDSPFYLALATALDDNLRAGAGLWGWSHQDLGGFPVASTFVPGPLGLALAVGLHRVASVPLPAAYSVVLAAAVMLPAVGVALVASRLGAAAGF